MAARLPTGFIDTVAANIRAECGFRGITQRDLGRAIGISPSRISERWRGLVQWQLEDIEAVAALFGIPPQQLCQSVEAHNMQRTA